MLKSLFIFVLIFIVTIFLRLYVLAFFAIPSSSMESVLTKGDNILVSKVHYGALTPASPYEIPWVNLLFAMVKGNVTKGDIWSVTRLWGCGVMHRKDVMVFRHPLKKQVFVKRCVALPGDTLQLVGGQLSINQAKKEVLSGQEKLARDTCKYLNPVLSTGSGRNKIYPGKGGLGWSLNNFGPLVVPAKGQRIKLTSRNIMLYGSLIAQHEDSNLQFKDGCLLSNGQQLTEYTFKKDYYFMLGDNRLHSNDSRYWGFVPKENIIGKAVMIFWSIKKNGSEYEWRWDRFCKQIK